MSYFVGDLDTRVVDEHKGPEGWHQLLAPFAFHSDVVGRTIAVPSGFVTDFASVPRIIGAWLLFGGKGKRAAVIHDWLYSTQMFPRDVCDSIFEEALKASGYSAFVVSGMYAGVCVGGWVAWRRKNVPQERDVQQLMEAP